MRITLISLLAIMLSCNQSNIVPDPTNLYVENNFSDYKHIHEEIQGWINEMIASRKNIVNQLIQYEYFKIDKLLLFNKNKCIGTINISSIASNKASSADKIRRFQGVKINNEWYLFMGASLVLPRDYYKYDKYDPLSFDELSYLARKEFLLPFYKIQNGQLVENHEAIDKYVHIQKGIEYPDGETNENWIKFYKQQTKDTIPQDEIDKGKREISGMEKPRSYEIKKRSWWDKIRGEKPPLFERSEWKNRKN